MRPKIQGMRKLVIANANAVLAQARQVREDAFKRVEDKQNVVTLEDEAPLQRPELRSLCSVGRNFRGPRLALLQSLLEADILTIMTLKFLESGFVSLGML